MVPAATTWTLVLVIEALIWQAVRSFFRKEVRVMDSVQVGRDADDGELFRMTAEKLRSEVDVRKSRDCASSRHDDAGLGVTWTSKRSCLHLW